MVSGPKQTGITDPYHRRTATTGGTGVREPLWPAEPHVPRREAVTRHGASVLLLFSGAPPAPDGGFVNRTTIVVYIYLIRAL